jgi:bifunctional DNA-binding transcriptional regulator/antitoxin component of YhaV-PrlF toxin-antitoxin module
MANKNSKERTIRKLTKVGNGSISVTIPIEDIRELGWREKQKVVVKRKGKKLIITDWKK